MDYPTGKYRGHTRKLLLHNRNQRVRRSEIHLYDSLDNVRCRYRPSTPCYRLVVRPVTVFKRQRPLFFLRFSAGDAQNNSKTYAAAKKMN